MNLNVCAKTTVGRRRENQDTYFHEIFDGPRGCLHAVAAVCDGMGGHEGGQTASRLAVEAIETRLGAIPDDPAQIDSWVTETLQSIQSTLSQAAQANPALEDMGTTLVMSLIGEETVWIVNIGDSRAYSISSEKAELLTRDHSSLQEALDQGMYTMEDIQSNEVLRSMSSAITRYVGPQANYPPDIYHFPRWAGGWLLLCSDGLTGNVSELIISEYELWKYVHGTDRIESAAEALVDLAYQNGSSDNITVVLLEIGDPSRAEVSVISNAETNETEISEAKTNKSKPERTRSFAETQWRNWLILLLVLAVLLCGMVFFKLAHGCTSLRPASDDLKCRTGSFCEVRHGGVIGWFSSEGRISR